MPTSYPPEAVETCLRLYLQFNGQQHDRIEAGMRRAGYGWTKQNLYTRGKGPNQKIGWIEKYGWDKALEEHRKLLAESTTLTADEKLVRSIEKRLARVEATLDAQPDSRDLGYQFTALARLLIDARTKLDAGRDTLAGFTAFWSRLLDWLTEIDPRAARALLEVEEQVYERAARDYGEEGTAADGG